MDSEDNIYIKEMRDLILSIKEKKHDNDDFEEDFNNIIKTYRKYRKYKTAVRACGALPANKK